MKIPTSYKAAIAALLILIAIICPQLAHAGISDVHTSQGDWTVIKKPETKRTVSANANGTLINVMIISPRPVLSPPWTVLGIGTVKPPSAHASDV